MFVKSRVNFKLRLVSCSRLFHEFNVITRIRIIRARIFLCIHRTVSFTLENVRIFLEHVFRKLGAINITYEQPECNQIN